MSEQIRGRIRGVGLAILAWAMALGLGLAGPVSGAAVPRVLYETGFEASEGFDPGLTLVGQGGWVGEGSGGNGLISDFIAGSGQHAFIGFGAPTNRGEYLNVWRPVNHVPGGTNEGRVRFSVVMSVEDSVSSTNRDDFRWSVYNVGGDRLFSLDFDNTTLEINYLLDDAVFVPTGWTFTNAQPYLLEFLMDFPANRWTAWLGGEAIAADLPLTTTGATRDFGDVDAVWEIRTPGKAGDNFMVFDDYRIVAEDPAPNPAPRLEVLGVVRPGQCLVRCRGTAGVRYVLEGGPDFRIWVPLKTNTMPADGFFDHLDEGGAAWRFYRAVER
jgi:hypothetical protein